jgi:two-component system phosphate regulon sensor histidine kinase PhoR
MNEFAQSSPSLYQLVARDRETTVTFSRLATLEIWTIALVHWLIEQPGEVTLWLKGDLLVQWCAQALRDGSRSAATTTIYRLEESPSAIADPLGIVVPLQAGQLHRQEASFAARSSHGSVVFAVQFPSAAVAGSIAYSFEVETIRRALALLDSAIAIADNTPAAIFNSASQPITAPSRDALMRLYHHHLPQTDAQIARIEQDSLAPSAAQHFFDRGLQELSTTLTRMKTALSLLHSTHLKPAQRERYLALLQQECDRQNSLINGMRLLTASETESDRASLTTTLSEVLPAIVSTYQPLAMEKGIQLGYTLATGLPLVACPPATLRQIAIHLLNNSLQFTPPNGRVSVKAQLKGEYIQLLVKDTGVGIARSEVDRIFESFYQGRATATETHSGAGLGLTLVRQLLDRCGGSISVSSKPNAGSTFKVLLPICRECRP